MLTYKIHFEDGQTRQVECIEGLNIGEWKVFSPDQALPEIPGALSSPVYPAGKQGQSAKGAGGYIFEWKNDVRKSGVTNQDTDQQGLAAVESIDIVSSGKAVPVIIAITVEE